MLRRAVRVPGERDPIESMPTLLRLSVGILGGGCRGSAVPGCPGAPPSAKKGRRRSDIRCIRHRIVSRIRISRLCCFVSWQSICYRGQSRSCRYLRSIGRSRSTGTRPQTRETRQSESERHAFAGSTSARPSVCGGCGFLRADLGRRHLVEPLQRTKRSSSTSVGCGRRVARLADLGTSDLLRVPHHALGSQLRELRRQLLCPITIGEG